MAEMLNDTYNWRAIMARDIAWHINPISRRAGLAVNFASAKWDHEPRSIYSPGAWNELTLGDIANFGPTHWQRMRGLGPKSIDVIKWVIDEAAEGRCPMNAKSGAASFDAYIPKCPCYEVEG